MTSTTETTIGTTTSQIAALHSLALVSMAKAAAENAITFVKLARDTEGEARVTAIDAAEHHLDRTDELVERVDGWLPRCSADVATMTHEWIATWGPVGADARRALEDMRLAGPTVQGDAARAWAGSVRVQSLIALGKHHRALATQQHTIAAHAATPAGRADALRAAQEEREDLLRVATSMRRWAPEILDAASREATIGTADGFERDAAEAQQTEAALAAVNSPPVTAG